MVIDDFCEGRGIYYSKHSESDGGYDGGEKEGGMTLEEFAKKLDAFEKKYDEKFDAFEKKFDLMEYQMKVIATQVAINSSRISALDAADRSGYNNSGYGCKYGVFELERETNVLNRPKHYIYTPPRRPIINVLYDSPADPTVEE